jgi:hypothetical protein
VSQVLFLLLLGPQFQEYFLTPYFFFKYTEKAVAATNKGLNFSVHTMGTGGCVQDPAGHLPKSVMKPTTLPKSTFKVVAAYF